jgi:hypothetical protein
MVVVFRARRTPEGEGEEYKRWFLRMSELARKMPGYISHKGYVADDGERLTLFEWESAETELRGAANNTPINKPPCITRMSAACSLSDISGWRDGVLYPLAGGGRGIRRGAFWLRRRDAARPARAGAAAADRRRRFPL